MVIETNTDAVHIRGEALSEIWWQGRQWAVTEYGIERRDGTYFLEGGRLAEIRPETQLADFPLHMCEKEWVDFPDFYTAWLVALVLHGHGHAFAPDVLRETYDDAVEQRREYGIPINGEKPWPREPRNTAKAQRFGDIIAERETSQ